MWVQKAMDNREGQGNLARGIIVGAAAGLVGTLAMTAFQSWWSKSQPAGPPLGSSGNGDPEPPTEKAADAISEATQGQDLSAGEREKAGDAVHFTMGTTCGAIYGALSEFIPAVTALDGVAYGSCVWLVANNAAVPSLGLSEPPSEQSTSEQVSSFLAHAVYGLSVDLTRRVLNKVFSGFMG